MSDKCAGCMNKFKFREKPRLCPECRREFCHVCIPEKKGDKKSSKKHSSADEDKRVTCVYCTRTLKQIKETEEAEILENFEERFHKHAHTTPPIRTKVQLDYTKMAPKAPKLPDEYQDLEERVRRLKESQKKKSQSSDAEMRDRLERLRGDSGHPKASSSDSDPSERQGGSPLLGEGGAPETRFDQTQDLLDRVAEEVKLDERLEETNAERDDNLHRRFLALKGQEGGDRTSTARPRRESDLDIEHFLKDMDIQVIDEEDPEKLLEDLKAMQQRHQQATLQEAESSHVQEIVAVARELGSQEQGGGETPEIAPYPTLPDTESSSVQHPEHKIDVSEVSKVMQQAVQEMREEEVKEKETQSYIKAASDRLTKLRSHDGEDCTVGGGIGGEGDEEEPDCIVKSKVTVTQLDFSWSHFGSNAGKSPTSTSAARQLGITSSGDFTPGERGGGGRGAEGGWGGGGGAGDCEDLDDSVSKLLDQMLAEAELDKRLEASGYDGYLKEKEHSDPQDKETGNAGPPQNSRQSGATAAAQPIWGGGEEPDLPWCCICNCDATLRCFDCDGDLYCTRCFSEGHQQFGLFDHQYVPYRAEK